MSMRRRVGDAIALYARLPSGDGARVTGGARYVTRCAHALLKGDALYASALRATRVVTAMRCLIAQHMRGA